MTVIDADAHVREPEAMFADLSEDVHPRRPIRVSIPTDTALGDFNSCAATWGPLLPAALPWVPALTLNITATPKSFSSRDERL